MEKFNVISAVSPKSIWRAERVDDCENLHVKDRKRERESWYRIMQMMMMMMTSGNEGNQSKFLNEDFLDPIFLLPSKLQQRFLISLALLNLFSLYLDLCCQNA
jgi:hypothetical protein